MAVQKMPTNHDSFMGFYEKIDKTIDKSIFWSIFIIGGEDETIENYL